MRSATRPRGPAIAGVVAGLAVTGLAGFLGVVFATIGFAWRMLHFESVILPTAVAVFAVHAAVAVGLLAAGWPRAALAAAWWPVVLLGAGLALMRLAAFASTT